MKNILDLIGNTPLVELKNIEKKYNLKGKIFAKVEYFNLTGSIKDRIALEMILDGERKGVLKSGYTIIEPTSGNTGIGLAAIGAIKGYKVIIVMPENMSIERIKMMKAYGAEVVLTGASEGMSGSIKKAAELKETMQNAVILGQFDNLANPSAHYKTTGPEIFSALDSKVDILVAGIGTGGTITGTGSFLKERITNLKIIGVEPETSPFLTKGYKGPHKIAGIGAGFKPSVLNVSLIDNIVPISNEDAFAYARELLQVEGLSCGISSGAALKAAVEEAKREENKDKNIVVILPDSGNRYLSTELFKEGK